MTAKQQMDEIVQDTLQAMLAMTDANDINNRANAGIAALDGVILSNMSDQDHLTKSKQTIADAQLKIGLNQREETLAELTKLAKKVAAASKKMDKAAAENLLAKVATVGSSMLDIANSAKTLADEIKSAVDDPGSADAEALADAANEAIDAIEKLKSL